MQTKIALQEQQAHLNSEGWFYIIMAVIVIVIAFAGFGPAAISTESRRGPLTWAVVSHGAIFGAWLLLFLTQTILITKRKLALHRLLGYMGAFLALLMVLSGYITAIAMARRGYDLSGDLIRGKGDPLELLVFQLGDLLSFTILVGLAIWYRSTPAVHKRLMLLATIASLMPAALTHIIGHSPVLREITAPIILLPLFMLLFARAVYERLSRGSIHPISLWVALALFVWANLRAVVIGPSDAWHNFAEWLIT
ncbi:hypothetical protein Q0590_34350 [Rhodocytophaga aerolata]|uniref:Uncharacterized protein n=1 Tax=Rhodocytophaga aerolata TaxID=455078 RepID=A0ABT8RJH3_9BACT|nr:hypothetical protein [Rhodocytophaga aerolata]MDO1451408.1 hypothetical protein [Rhodocytophaga aerolata]